MEVAHAEEIHVDAGGERLGAGLARADGLDVQAIVHSNGHTAADRGIIRDVGRGVGHVGIDIPQQANASAAAHGQSANGGFRAFALVFTEDFEAAQIVGSIAFDACLQVLHSVGYRRIDTDAQGGDVHLYGTALLPWPHLYQ